MTFRHKLAHRLALLRDRAVAVAVAGLALLWVASCERPLTVTEPNPSVAQLVVSPNVVTLQQNQSQDFTAVGFTTTGDSAQIGVTWSVTGGTIDTSSSGKRHYGHYKNASCGNFKVAATSHPGSKSDTANVTVTCAPSPVASVSVAPPSATVPVGQSVQLSATPKDANGNALTGRAVTWSSSNTSVANVDGSGLVTAAAAGSATITATSEGQSGTSSITVTPPAANKFVIGDRVQTTDVTNIRNAPAVSGTLVGTQPAGAQGTVVGGPVVDAAGDQAIRWQVDFDQGADGWAAEPYLTKAVAVVPVSSVTVSPASATVQVGQTVQLTATPKDASGNPLTGRAVTWSSSNTAVASVDGNGLVTGGTSGSATITATSEGQSGTSSITVSGVAVSSVTVTPASANLPVGQTVQLTATPKDANGNPLTGRMVTWSSSNNSVASVTSSGLVSGGAAGSATITATSEGQSGTASITVTSVPVASVSVTPTSANVNEGKTVQLTATPKDGGGNPLSGRTIAWSSSNTAVATVSSSGLVTGKVAGSATITATSEGQSGASAITVVHVPVASVTVSPASGSVPAGSTLQLTATPKDASGNALTGRTITWSSSDNSVATVSSSGLVSGVVAGSATITATSEGQSGPSAITVTPPSAGATFGHVFIVTEENTNYSSVIGSSSMPYLNGLAQQYGLATQYYANTHPSIGNYFELSTGQIISNNDGFSTVQNVPNVVRSLLAAGKTWKSYAESIPNACYLGGDTGNYARKHNIFPLLSDVANDPVQACNNVPFTQFATDLANGTLPHFSNIVPNLCNDAHDCSLSTADTWLKNNIDPLIKSAMFQRDGLLIIVFDESGGDNTNGGGRVVWVAVSPKSKPGYQSTTLYQHQSTLRLILKGLGVNVFPGAAASAPDMTEFFTP
ncbi:MAG: hypothetical protein DMD25_14875 [Gemmatimonadetes bacterium]|nr:MAG: hypothetical protein DMD25_14875 [Gemmatimonadota bacterium]